MKNSYAASNGNGPTSIGQIVRHSRYEQYVKGSLPWLDLRVFYVRVSRSEIQDSAPEYLTLNHIPLHPNTLLDVNGVRTSIYSDGAFILLRRDRLDKRSEEATFVCTDTIRITGSVKFEVFDKDVLVVSGVLELCNSNGFTGESRKQNQRWNMNCESDIIAGTGLLKAKQFMGSDSASPTIEVYVAGSFLGIPIILIKALKLSSRKKQKRKGMLDSIPEYEAEFQNNFHAALPLQILDDPNHKPESEDYNRLHWGTEYLEGEDRELSWFNAGVRVGVGIGLSVCVGIGIGMGLLVRTYQGTTRSFRKRLL